VKIREQRRAYFRVLRAEQSAGIQAAVKPRLSLDSVDSFAEEIVMRMIEGTSYAIQTPLTPTPNLNPNPNQNL
jgi:hypothetical protein